MNKKSVWCFEQLGVFAVMVMIGLSANVMGNIIPSSRAPAWNPGVPGGIPNRTTIYTTLPAGSSMSSIQSALNSCPSNQVVLLSPGTYNLSGNLQIPSYVTLRGAGTNTILSLASSGNGNGGVTFGSPNFSPWPPNASYTTINSGANAGSTSITVASASGFAVGNYFVVNELNDTAFVTPTNEYYPPADWCGACGDGGSGSEDRLLGQTLEVTSVNGTTIGFNPPLYFTYDPSLSPRAVPFANNLGAPAGKALVKYAGLENVKLYANNGAGYGYNIVMNEAAYCWVKNIESDFAEGDHASLNWCFRCEIRDSYFHDGFSHGPGTHDDAVKLGYKTTACLVENNTFWRMHTSLIGNYGCAGNVIAYNFSTNTYHSPSLTWQIMDFDFHNAHPSFNLFEGNIGVHWEPDSLHGSSSHSTCLRNWFTGANYSLQPLDVRGPIQSSGGTWQNSAAVAFSVDYTSQTNNLVGNIGGCAQLVQTGGSYLSASPGSRANPVCFAIGFDSSEAPRDSGQTMASTLMHGNYDFVSRSQHWDATIADHVIPNSYYLAGKPAFFGNCTWPPVDPGNPSTLNVTNLPAAYRFIYGVLLAGGPPSTNPPAITGQPQSQGITVGGTVSLAVTASGDPLTYKWYFNGAAITGATSSSYTKANCQIIDAGIYTVVVSNPYGSVTSSIATLTVTIPPPPVITGQPQSQGITEGDTAHFAVTASGVSLTYIWRFNAATIASATSSSYTKPNCQISDSGSYDVVVSNPFGSVTSSIATLTVTSAPPGTAYIWPLGDSVTRGYNAPGSYRLPLYQMLTNNGLNPIFVGSTNDAPVPGLPYCSHDGWAGYEIGQLATNLPNWTPTFHPPDYVLLMIGLNDFRHNTDLAHATNRLESLIVQIATTFPSATICVADLNPWTSLEPTNSVMNLYYNPYIPGVVARQASLGRNVTLCDMRGKIFATDLQVDNTHPNASGNAKLAVNWLSMFIGPKPDAPGNLRRVGP